jgi:hypothetical protein
MARLGPQPSYWRNWARDRATRNLPGVVAVQAGYLNVFDIVNADMLVITKKAVDLIESWLGETKKATTKPEADEKSSDTEKKTVAKKPAANELNSCSKD